MVQPLHTPRVKSAYTSRVLFFLVLASLFFGLQTLRAQATGPVICPITASVDANICAPNCAPLTGTYTQVNAPTSYTVSSIPYAPDPFNAGTGVALFDDSWSALVNIGFSFCFYGNTYTQCCIGSNGLITFDAAQANG